MVTMGVKVKIYTIKIQKYLSKLIKLAFTYNFKIIENKIHSTRSVNKKEEIRYYYTT